MSARRSTPRGQMTQGTNSGPAVMLMPPHIRATFMPNPPLQHIPPLSRRLRRKNEWTGVASFMVQFETTNPTPPRIIQPTPASIKQEKQVRKKEEHQKALEPLIEHFRREQRRCGGEFEGMNCYNTLFVGRLAYEVKERQLLREMESFGPIKDVRIIKNKDGDKSRYAFIEYEHEDDMKRAYRAADGMKIEGREIVVDVERGHTVPSWLPRRLGGGLGGTRLGGKDVNVTRPGRYDPSRLEIAAVPGPMMMMMGSGGGMGRGMMPPHGSPPPQQPPYGYGGGGGGPGGYRDGPPPGAGPPPPYGMGRGRGGGSGSGSGGDNRFGGPPPSREWDRGGGGGEWRRDKRPRSNSPDSRHGRDRRRSSGRY